MSGAGSGSYAVVAMIAISRPPMHIAVSAPVQNASSRSARGARNRRRRRRAGGGGVGTAGGGAGGSACRTTGKGAVGMSGGGTDQPGGTWISW